MRVLILGANGFLGARLASQLAASARLGGQPVHELVLVDARPMPEAPPSPAPACTVTRRVGSIADAALLDSLFAQPVQCVFHLAATLTVESEADVQRGLDTNVAGLLQVLARCRSQAPAPPRLVFASSIATYGGGLSDTVDDDTRQLPGTAYGTHKLIAELLLADDSRRGTVDGRVLRLPIVLTHPGPASGSLSDQVAALVREPLRGNTAVCRMAPGSRLVVSTVERVVDALLHLAALPPAVLPARRTLNLPSLAVTPAELLQAVQDKLPAGAAARVAWQPDAAVQAIVDSWPRAFDSPIARGLGFGAPTDADEVVASFIASERGAA